MLEDSRPAKIVLSTPVWGEQFVELFCNFVVRNLIAPGNLPALARFDCVYHIYTDDLERSHFHREPFNTLRKLLAVEMHSTRDFIGIDKYGTLTACYADAISRAVDERAAMIFLNADMIYSADTFTNLLKLIEAGKRCIEIEGFRVLKDPVRKELEDKCEHNIAIRSSDLVKLALNQIHPISASHFWEPEADLGYMPFHTYWRAGAHGLVAKASHIYPIYLYPRNWDLGSARTIDWDLVDSAGMKADDEYVVCDSEEIFAIEMSDASYCIPPTFPNGCSVEQMRGFIDQHCNEGNRRRLNYTIRLRANPNEDGLGWAPASLKALLWTKAVVNRSNIASALLWTIEAPGRLRRAHQRHRRLQQAIRRDAKSMPDRLGAVTPLFLVTSIDPSPYRRLAEAVPSAFQKVRREWFPILHWSRTFDDLNGEYERICTGPDTPLKETDSLQINLSTDPYFGTGWRRRQSSWRNLGRDGIASLFVRICPRQHYRLRFDLAALPPEHANRFTLEANNVRLPQQGIELTGRWEQWAIIPAGLIPERNGVVKLSARLQDATGNRLGDVAVANVHIQKFGSLQESVLEAFGLSNELYASYCGIDDDYRKLYENVPEDAATNECAATKWTEALDDLLLQKTAPSVQELVDNLAFSDHIVGTGWGRSARWGEQSYRWLCGTNSATIFVKISGCGPCVLRTYIYTCPQDILPSLRIRLNDQDILEQGLVYDKDRYFLWCKISSAARARGALKISYFTECTANNVGSGDTVAAKEIRRRTTMVGSNTAFTRLVCEEDLSPQ